MKKIVITLILLVFALSLCACTSQNDELPDCVRIHIRANSNEAVDQNVKLAVRDEIVAYLTPVLANCKNKEDAKEAIRGEIPAITAVADGCLRSHSFPYTATVSLRREKFPYREYMDFTFPEGVYDALIIELGSAEGNNWWCVCFPPLCFVPDGEEDENFGYKSRILEIIKKSRG